LDFLYGSKLHQADDLPELRISAPACLDHLLLIGDASIICRLDSDVSGGVVMRRSHVSARADVVIAQTSIAVSTQSHSITGLVMADLTCKFRVPAQGAHIVPFWPNPTRYLPNLI
jgi:hypothetical protein